MHAAILTPPDPITQIGLAIPLLFYMNYLYNCRFTEKKIDKEKKMHNLKDLRKNLDFIKKN